MRRSWPASSRRCRAARAPPGPAARRRRRGCSCGCGTRRQRLFARPASRLNAWRETPRAGRSSDAGRPLGYIAAATHRLRSRNRSAIRAGKPIDILARSTNDNRIAGAATDAPQRADPDMGISTADIERLRRRLRRARPDPQQSRGRRRRADLPDIISGATVSTGVIRDAILRGAPTAPRAAHDGGAGPKHRPRELPGTVLGGSARKRAGPGCT